MKTPLVHLGAAKHDVRMVNEVMHPDLLREIIAHCAAAGISRTQFGVEAMGDTDFVHSLIRGRECKRATLKKVRAHIAKQTAGGGVLPKPGSGGAARHLPARAAD